uniref:DUF4116 domain-containing protein n=1 Tax=Gongylonema pulchrum TaxID=637853 RepID=A0A183EFG8_9BILA
LKKVQNAKEAERAAALARLKEVATAETKYPEMLKEFLDTQKEVAPALKLAEKEELTKKKRASRKKEKEKKDEKKEENSFCYEFDVELVCCGAVAMEQTIVQCIGYSEGGKCGYCNRDVALDGDQAGLSVFGFSHPCGSQKLVIKFHSLRVCYMWSITCGIALQAV